MPYASCLASCSVVGCCSFSQLNISLSCCSLPNTAQLVLALLQLSLSVDLGFCSLFYPVHSCGALWDSLSRLMPSGIACLASQPLIGQLHSGMAYLACDWLIYDWCPAKCNYSKASCDWLLL